MFFDDRSMVDSCGEKLYNDFKNCKENSHPRVMINKKGIEELKELIKTDEILKPAYDAVKVEADEILGVEPRGYIKVTYRLLESSKEVFRRVLKLGFAYFVTGDEKYAERAFKEVEFMCTEWPDWNSYHTLDTAEAMMAATVCYDWFYEYLTPDRKKLLEDSILSRGLLEILDDYLGNGAKRSDPRFIGERPMMWLDYNNNWCFVCNGSALCASLALFDCDNIPKNLLKTIAGFAYTDFSRTLEIVMPEDGAYVEGTMYWNYFAEYLIQTLDTMKNSLGTDYDLPKIKGFSKSPYFLFNLTGKRPFNFSDSGGGVPALNHQVMWFARYFNDENLYTIYKEREKDFLPGLDYKKLLYYRPMKKLSGEPDVPLDVYYKSIETVVLRNGFTDSENLNFVGLHAGDNSAPHSHLDCGSFVLDMQGERFALDLGPDDYNIPGKFYRYRYSAEGHNTYVINRTDIYTQDENAPTEIINFGSGEGEAFAICDITKAYAMYLTKIQRGIKLYDNKTKVLIQDELKADESFEAWWQMHTEAAIKISDDKKSAVLTINDKSIKAQIKSPCDAGFEVLPARPFPDTPVFKGQDPNKGVKKLCIHFKDIKEAVVAVEFTALGAECDSFELTELKDWRI